MGSQKESDTTEQLNNKYAKKEGKKEGWKERKGKNTQSGY